MHNHEKIIEGGENPCPLCPTIPTQALMSKVICVGFGESTVRRDGVIVIDGERIFHDAENQDELPTFADAEALAAADPDHDWRVVLNGPLHGETYQRQGHEVWLCIESNEGFA